MAIHKSQVNDPTVHNKATVTFKKQLLPSLYKTKPTAFNQIVCVKFNSFPQLEINQGSFNVDRYTILVVVSMEVTGVVFRQSPYFSPVTGDASNSRCFPTMKKPNSFSPKQRSNRKSFAACVISDEFTDKSHLQYYNGPRLAIKEKESKKKEMKKKLKLLKGLSKNLSNFSDMGFCLKPEDGLDQQVKGQMISEATEVLVGQLQKLKEESKRMKKEEKAKKKASKMMMMTECKDSSSSSSESSSSESDCDNNVVNMSQLKTHQDTTSSVQCLENLDNIVPETTAISKVAINVNAEEDCGKKIEVCMGGKCKKSGAAMLLENFNKAVGGEASVVGCKCMGKCRDGPNVKVRSDEASVMSSLCIGVGLEDVESIVTNFFGRSSSDMVPAMSSSV
ncbi:hypothetical protein QVD17_39445 [Tagetes erecta]|uniref:Uncharacterized protein n=1 Tax=Tagetes erecta TaxID=13708 RepID=A0AAD8JQK1_TARER|nr:hypothetical protein QVD17_39445 [Tagetes erecta]